MSDAYDFEFDSLDGQPLPLARFRGKPVLVVNTASKCGLTPQYEGLESLWADYKDRGLIVLGVPSNNFAGQEPGTEAEIAQFCSATYGVDFPMTAKTEVIGDGAHPFYRWVRAQAGEDGEPKWNFHKILIGKDGALAGLFGPRTEPRSAEVIDAVESAL